MVDSGPVSTSFQPGVGIGDCLARSRSSRPAGCTRVQAAPSLPRLRCCLARSRSSRPAGCTPGAGCPEPPQAPVLPRSLPLLSPGGLHPGCRLPRASPGSGAASLAARLARQAARRAGCPEPPKLRWSDSRAFDGEQTHRKIPQIIALR